MLKKLVSAVSILMFTSGCAVITHVPANRFDSPEAIGKGGEVGGGLEGGNQWVITQDDTQNPPDLTDPLFQRSTNDAFVNGAISLSGLSSRLDIGAKIRFNSVLLAQAKFQILGAPRSTAKEGNFSFSVTAAAGGSSHSQTDTSSTLFGTTTTTANDSFNESAIDFGAIMGYRFAYWGLLYGGVSWTRQTYSGTLSQTASGGTNNYLYSGQLQQSGVDVGVEFDPALLVCRLEYAVASTKSVSTSQQYTSGYTGVEIGFRFGGPKPSAKGEKEDGEQEKEAR